MNLALCALTLTLAGQPVDAPAAASRPAPASWVELEQAYLLECSAPIELRVAPEPRQVGEALFRLEGGRLVREGPNRERVVVGVLSALKDVTPETRANVARATAAFRKAGVDVIVANGDIALNEFDLEAAMDLLGETGLPVLVLIGNSEGRGAFNRAFVAAEARHPNLFNMNWVRHVQLGRVDLLSLPGYYNRPFIYQNSGCHLGADEIEAVGRYLEPLQRAGRTPVLVSHAPPRSRGKAAIDRAFEHGNVGDPEMARLIVERRIPFGLHGHILEAGGRASSDVRLGAPARPGKPYRRLFVNAGAASAMPWTLLDGKTATGMAMIVTFDGKGARYQVLRLGR